MPIGRLRKPCRKCSEMFLPSGKFQRICCPCQNKIYKIIGLGKRKRIDIRLND